MKLKKWILLFFIIGCLGLNAQIPQGKSFNYTVTVQLSETFKSTLPKLENANFGKMYKFQLFFEFLTDTLIVYSRNNESELNSIERKFHIEIKNGFIKEIEPSSMTALNITSETEDEILKLIIGSFNEYNQFHGKLNNSNLTKEIRNFQELLEGTMNIYGELEKDWSRQLYYKGTLDYNKYRVPSSLNIIFDKRHHTSAHPNKTFIKWKLILNE